MAIAAAMVAWPALADDLPVVVSADAINGRVHSSLRRSGGGDSWSMEWYWDDQGRVLILYLVKSLRPAVAGMVDDLDEGYVRYGTEVQKESNGRLAIWGGQARWLLESELAMKAPLFTDEATRNQAPRGPERNYCVSFLWISDSLHRAMQGAYCKVFPVGEIPTAEAMLTALGLRLR